LIRQISVHELAARLKAREPICLVDVRQSWEHEIAALPNSVLLPLNELPNRAKELEASDGALVVAYCHHGIRSLSAAALLAGMGFDDVVSLHGGIDAWSREVDPNVPRY